MQFEAHPRLLQLLIGSNLYPSEDVVVRELVQNAQDAIEWRRERGDGGGGTILVRFSASKRWLEIVDDGIGMDAHDLEESFLKVGRSKLEALGEEHAPGEQVAFFGIGILSVFLIAESLRVDTRKLHSNKSIAVIFVGIDQEATATDGERDSVGTTVRVALRADVSLDLLRVPEILSTYVRHVQGVRVENVDEGTVADLAETWSIDGLLDVRTVDGIGAVRSGRMGLSPGLRADSGVVGNRLTLCNAGFLVEASALDLLPLPPVGYTGELDVHSSALNIVMARERYQRDASWNNLGKSLADSFVQHAEKALGEGSLRKIDKFDPPPVRRNILIWSQNIPNEEQFSRIHEELNFRLFSTVAFAFAERDATSLERVVQTLPGPRLYVRRVGSATQRSRHIDDEGFPVQLVEEIRDSIRVGALRAKGFPVLEAAVLTFTQEVPGAASAAQVDEASLAARILQSRNIEVLDITQAPEEDMELGGIERLPILRRVLNVGGELRFACVPDSQRRVVTDPSGIRYLNVNNETVRRLLRVIPAAVSNPLKERLLTLYLGLENYQFLESRQRVLELLESENLGALATSETALLTSRVVRAAVDELLLELNAA